MDSRRDRQGVDAHTDGVENGVGDGGDGRVQPAPQDSIPRGGPPPASLPPHGPIGSPDSTIMDSLFANFFLLPV